MRLFKYLILSLLIPWGAEAGVWDSTYEGGAGVHAVILGTTAPSLLDEHIRNIRQEVRYRAEVEHIWGDNDGVTDDNGLHRLGSARCYMQDEPPTTLNDSHSDAVNNIFDYDNTSGVGAGSDSGASGLEDSATNSAGGIEDDIGHGRCWIDTNDNFKMYIFLGIAGDNTPSTVADGWYPVSQLGQTNLVFHGSFDGTDGDGDASATVLPYGWTNRFTGVTGTHSYTDPVTITEGEGLMYVHTNNVGGTDSGILQILGGLKKSTWYHFTARASATATCQLRIEGTGVTTLPSSQEDETTGTGAFETIEVWAKTDASANDLTIILQGPDNSDICSWKHIMATERVQVAPTPGVIVVRASASVSDTTCDGDFTGAGSCSDIITVTINPPGPGYYVDVQGKVRMDTQSGATACTIELTENTSQVDVTRFVAPDGVTEIYLRVDYTSTSLLVPGTPLVYTINGKELAGVCQTDGTATLTAILIQSGS